MKKMKNEKKNCDKERKRIWGKIEEKKKNGKERVRKTKEVKRERWKP